jgi:AraC family transcriptional activator of tynA and feaB
MYERWSTLHIEAPRRLAFWREATAQAFLSMTPRLGRLGDFQAVMTHRGLGGIALNEVRAPAHGMARTAQDVARGDGPYLFVNLYAAGGARVRQRGGEAEARPGELLVFDSEAFELEQPQDMALLSLAIPRAQLQSAGWPPQPMRATGSASARLLAAQMRELAAWPHDLGDHEAGCVADLLCGGVRAVLAQHGGSGERSAGHTPALRAAVRRLIEQHHADPAFGAAEAAAELGIALRTLHAWMAREGASFGARLMQHRLERAHAMLCVAPAHVTVAEVAARCGFVSAAHFARRFRAHYGIAPTQLRRLH